MRVNFQFIYLIVKPAWYYFICCELISARRVSFHDIDEISYCLHQLKWVLICVLEDYLCLWLVSVVSEFRRPSHVEPIAILVIIMFW